MIHSLNPTPEQICNLISHVISQFIADYVCCLTNGQKNVALSITLVSITSVVCYNDDAVSFIVLKGK